MAPPLTLGADSPNRIALDMGLVGLFKGRKNFPDISGLFHKPFLGVGFEYFLFSPLLGEMILLFFQMGGNHQLDFQDPYQPGFHGMPCFWGFWGAHLVGWLDKEYNDVDVAVHEPSYDTLGRPVYHLVRCNGMKRLKRSATGGGLGGSSHLVSS